MEGVDDAQVVWDQTDPKGLRREPVTRAAVFVKARGSEPLKREVAKAIRNLVVGANAGLEAENVTITDQNGTKYATVESETDLDDALIERKGQWEENYAAKVLNVDLEATKDAQTGRTIGSVPRQVTVAVGVPATYYQELWRGTGNSDAPTPDRLAQLEREEEGRIRAQVASAIGHVGAAADAVSVATILQLGEQAAQPAPSTQQSVAQLASRWGGTVGLAVVALAGLLLLRSLFLRPTTPAPTAVRIERGAAATKTQRFDAGRSAEQLRGRALQERSATLVDRDPEAAADVLRHWIGTNQT
jgi:flagellar biosynthesis/type III secretory pathway M-ring protein FliF/YscJ